MMRSTLFSVKMASAGNPAAASAQRQQHLHRGSSICTEAAASMTGSMRGLIACIKKKNPNVKWTHFVIHREALVSKKMSPVLHDVLNDSIKVINFMKSRPRNARLFRRL